jgi:DNA-binding transcriptional regulator YdaS (Cro superfamily)
MQGKKLLEAIAKKITKENNNQETTYRRLAETLGVNPVNLWQWRKIRTITPLQVANLIQKARKSAIRLAERQAIRPIVEFFELDGVESRSGTFKELFAPPDAAHQPIHTFLG